MKVRIGTIGLAMLLTATTAEAQGGAQPPAGGEAPRSTSERTVICRGGVIPAGWILVNDVRSTEMCSGSNPAAVNLYNVWAIERFDTKPVGASMQVCSAAPTPPGWVLEDVFRSKELCGHPDEYFAPNVKRIRRVR